jgi:hypothetical protein
MYNPIAKSELILSSPSGWAIYALPRGAGGLIFTYKKC